MTKYILNSGGLGGKPDLARQFFREVCAELGPTPHFLICLFASPREQWEQKYQQDVDGIPNLLPDTISPTFTMALPEQFPEQIAQADALYIRGGDDHLLRYWLQQYPLAELLKEKTVAGNSAGSNIFATHFWTCDWRASLDGLGLLPIKFISHYNSNFGYDDPRGPIDWQAAYDELAAHGDSTLPIHAPKEGEYVVIRN